MAEKNNANRLKNLLGSAAAPVRPAQEVVVAPEQPPAVEAEPPIRGQGYQTGYQDTEIALRPTASQLSVPLQDIARHYVGARRRSGEAVLDSARWLSEARSLAEHGEWYTFLEATGTSEDTAETLLNLHRRAMSDGRFAEAVRLNWLGQSAAGLLARPTTPPEVVAEVLSADAPPKVEAIRRKIKQAKTGQSQAAVPAQIPEFPGFASVQGDAAQIPEIPGFGHNVDVLAQTPEIPGFGHTVAARVPMLPSTDALALLHQVADALAMLAETADALPATVEVQQALERAEQSLGALRCSIRERR